MPPERFQLAALVQCLGRASAARAVAEHGSAAHAFARLTDPPVRPRHLADQCARHGIEVLVVEDSTYPALLRAVDDPPPVLYSRGDPGLLLRPAVAVVGARRCTRAGAEVAAALAAALTVHGLVVVSGLALGIDSAAHRAALSGGTAAVLGSGLACPYPARNRDLARAIVDAGGLCLSEYPPQSAARNYHFPERNRVISGLCLGVVVVEAGEHSGSLITARLALDQGREVCAVPGAVSNPLSRGCHRLLRQGAALVETADDVVEALGLEQFVARATAQGVAADPTGRSAARMAEAPGTLAPILAAVESCVTTLDEIVVATGVDGPAASAALVELELAGFVRQVPGGYIRRPSG